MLEELGIRDSKKITDGNLARQYIKISGGTFILCDYVMYPVQGNL